MWVDLDLSEVIMAGVVGVKRRTRGIQQNRSEPHGKPRTANGDSDLWGIDIEGSGAEYAVARTLNRFWRTGIKQRLADALTDVGYDIQVRSTTNPRATHLLVYETDRESDYFFFVRGRMPKLEIVGWIHGSDAKVERFWQETPRGTMAFWIPESELIELNDQEWEVARDHRKQ